MSSSGIKIMIVDDEKMAVEYLHNLVPWDDYGFEIVCEASSTEMAVGQYARCKPDIVITDICMPMFDGIELARRLLSENNGVKILLLSSYSEFEYAQSALSLGVSGYILKHEITSEAILQRVLKLRDEINTKRKESRVMREQALKALISGRELNAETQEYLGGLFRPESSLIIMDVRTDRPYPLFGVPAQEKSPLEKSMLDGYAFQLPESYACIATMEMDRGEFVLFWSAPRAAGKRDHTGRGLRGGAEADGFPAEQDRKYPYRYLQRPGQAGLRRSGLVQIL